MYAILVKDKTKIESQLAITKLITFERERFNHPIKYIRFDGDRGFLAVQKYFEDEQVKEVDKITFNSQSSPYTNHNRMVDRAIRRLRDMTENVAEIFDGSYKNNAIIQQVVHHYNNLIHYGISKLTPLDMHTDINKEWAYIRRMKEKLYDRKRLQMKEGFWNYKPNVTELRIYLDPDKTKNMFDKNRRKFKTFGLFQEYKHGNVVALLRDGRKVEVPIYYTIPDAPEKHPITNIIRNKNEKVIAALDDDIPGFDKSNEN